MKITVNGRPVEASPGQTVAAVLLTNGQTSWRTTRHHARPRGVFCGIGACHDCLVVVNGTPDVRACQRVIRDGDEVSTQQGAVLPRPSGQKEQAGRPTPAAAEQPGPAVQRITTTPPKVVDVAVVGGGPAGIAAALAAADAGVEVLLVDSAPGVGGQFNRQVGVAGERPELFQHGWKAFVAKRDRLAAHPRITHLAETSVWALEQGKKLWVQRGPADGVGREVFAIEAKAIVLATGAYDRVLPFPGWDLPGVYSAGAAQALAKGQRVAVGKRVLVAGIGPFLLPVAESLVGVGAEVVTLLEANSIRTVRKGWATDPLVATSKLREAVGYGAMLARHRIPLKHGWTVTAAHGGDRVEAVTIARVNDDWSPISGTERRITVDAVCLGFGFTAQLELAVSARCELTTGPDGGPAVVVDADQQTTTRGVFAAGELTGIGGADLAAAEGQVAGTAAALAAAQAGTTPLCAPFPQKTAPEVRISCTKSADARKQVGRGRRFAAALAKAYPVRDGWREWSGPETVVCRCEEVTRGDIEGAVVERGVADGRALKLTSRAGLGLCQGRVCSRTVAELAGPNDVPHPSMKRPIAVPVRLRDLAEAQVGPTEEEL
ncbi:FAD-dependent oxidoreductase [Kribbella sp. NPDC050124]|uniref:FAD-dependent oxidoreductase n=1 Tax=Kribbella sp. NPDC050124 TaxID=3364114 RepID=UPI00378B1D56